MRILTVGTMYPPHHLGGYELLWQAAVRGLRAAGHDVRVVATNHHEAGAGGEQDPDVHRDLRWFWQDHEFPRLAPRERRRLDRHNAAVFDRHACEFGPDVVSWWALGGLSMSLLRRPTVPATAWVIDAWPVYGPRVDQWRRLTRGRVAFDATDWVFCSAALRDQIRTRVPGIGPGTVQLPGVASVFVEHQPRGWTGELLYAGRLDERKGIGTAIEALSQLAGMRLRIVGDGDQREAARLRRLGERLGVADRVTFEPAVSRAALSAVYAAADVALFPVTWFEPFGLVPLEAMAVGRPVVATGAGGSGDYLRDGENALLFKAGDAAALAVCVRRLAEDAGLRDVLRVGGLRTAGELTESRWIAAVCADHEAQSTRTR